jgi:5-methyltetrahydropteroyltriglutamate--homocysteine methyltransferase
VAKKDKPPFRADHVGSLLRPERLKAARERLLGPDTAEQNLAPHDNVELRAVENACIEDVIALQKRAGLRSATDGEFRRRSWWLELIMNWEGFSATRQGEASPFGWHDAEGRRRQDFSHLQITGKIRWRRSAVVRAFEFLKSHTDAVPKVTIPAPQVVHIHVGGDAAIRESLYGDTDPFWEDVISAYRKEFAALIDAGAKYIQFDDTAIAFLCDPAYQEAARAWDQEPEDALDEYARRMNQVLDGRPGDVTVTLHQCRGNREGMWAAKGGYDLVADVMFNQINVDGYFLEYDSERAGTFEPLRFLPKGKVVALGLVTTKRADRESADELKCRIEEASTFTPIERLALTPQCGFASSVVGNPLGEADEEAKLRRIVEVAAEVWPDA